MGFVNGEMFYYFMVKYVLMYNPEKNKFINQEKTEKSQVRRWFFISFTYFSVYLYSADSHLK